MKRNVIACLAGLFLCSLNMEGQVFRPNSEAGIFAGASYYLGDINPRGQFYRPGFSFGALFKHNFTEHHILRVNVFYGQLKGDDLDFKNEYQQKMTPPRSFETSLMDCQIGYEFNFMPYIINRKRNSQTPYIFVGVGYSLIQTTSTGVANDHFTIPFGVGYKYRFNDKIAVGCEWGLRKAFSDRLDGVSNPGNMETSFHNNDWYSFAGVFVTFKVFEKEFICPGMKDIKVYK